MVSGSLIREARLRAGFTQAELGVRLGKPESVISRWERNQVVPNLEAVREAVRACNLELTFQLLRFDDSLVSIVDEHLRMTPAERFQALMTRVRFDDLLARL